MPKETLLSRVFLFHFILYLRTGRATHLGFSMDILESEFPLERALLQGAACGSTHSCFLTLQGDTLCAGALSVHSPVHFYYTASPKTGIGLSQRQWIRKSFRLKPRASDDFLLLQNRHTLPSSSIFSVQSTPWPWALHLLLNPVFCCENTKSEIRCLLIK